MREAFELINAIPAFFYDLICRFVPGGILIYLIRPGWFHTPPEGFGVVALLAAIWAVGFTLDGGTSWLAHLIQERSESKVQKNCCRLWSFITGGLKMEKLGFSIYKVPVEQRLSIIRAIADRAFFRSMIFISVLAVISNSLCWLLSPDWAARHPTSWFCGGHGWWSALGVLVFIFAWIGRGHELNQEIREARAKPPGESASDLPAIGKSP